MMNVSHFTRILHLNHNYRIILSLRVWLNMWSKCFTFRWASRWVMLRWMSDRACFADVYSGWKPHQFCQGKSEDSCLFPVFQVCENFCYYWTFICNNSKRLTVPNILVSCLMWNVPPSSEVSKFSDLIKSITFDIHYFAIKICYYHFLIAVSSNPQHSLGC